MSGKSPSSTALATAHVASGQTTDTVDEVRSGFWPKIRGVARRVPFVLDAVASYYCMLDRRTPAWAKATVAAALAYFISPVDVIPDILFGVGYTDDAAVISMALSAVGKNVTSDHYAKARKALS